MSGGRIKKSLRAIPEHCVSETLERVSVAETDMMGIVHHANYVTYFEKGRLEYMRRRGFSYKEMIERGYHMPVVELNVRYKRPAHFDDLLRVETRLGAFSRVTARFDYVVKRWPAQPLGSAAPTPDLLLEAHVLLACIDVKNRPRQLPEDIVQGLLLPEAAPVDRPFIPGSRVDRAGNA